MFKPFGQRPEKRKQNMKQLWEREFNIVKQGLDEEQVVAFIDDLIKQHKASQRASAASLRSLFKQATTDAEQIAASIKMKAQTEAEAEGARIIAQAKEEVQEIKRSVEIATQKEAENILEDILAVANRKAEITETESKQKALLFLLKTREDVEEDIGGEYKRVYSRLSSLLQDLMNEGHKIEMELKGKRARLWESKNFELKEHEAALLSAPGAVASLPETSAPTEIQIEPAMVDEEKTEDPTQLREEVAEEEVEQAVQPQAEAPEEKTEPAQLREEVAEEEVEQAFQSQAEAPEEKTEPAQRLKSRDSRTRYDGEVELAIAVPVELKIVTKFYNFLQTVPEIKILYTKGSWDRGTTITVVLDKPIPLISLISKMPGVEVTAELPQKDDVVKERAGLVPGTKKKGVKRIKLTLREVGK